MEMFNKKLVIIAGPTATGKTKLALNLANRYGGELVSADSRQVYQGMDIGTGKDVKGKFNLVFFKDNFKIGYYEMEKKKIWLLDIIKPDYIFNVSDYQKCGKVVLDDIWQRGKLPFLVGGSGFYIKSLTEKIDTIGVEPDWKLRRKLETYDVEKLQKLLKKNDPQKYQRMNQSDKKNPRRLIRAIEVSLSPIKKNNLELLDNINTLYLGLTAPPAYLNNKIDQRVEERLEVGMEKEIKELLNQGFNWKNSVLGATLAYSEWEDFFNKTKNLNETINKWKKDEYDYAKRQMTWFKKNKKINWFDISLDNWQGKVENLVDSWYIEKDAKES